MAADTDTHTQERNPYPPSEGAGGIIQPPSADEVEIEGTTEAGISAEAKANEAQREEQESIDVLDVILPKAEAKMWAIGPESMRREYIQKPLSFIAKMQWFSLVGDVLDKALSGPDAMSLNSLMSTPMRGGQFSLADFRDADTFVQAIGKLLSVAPDFLTKSYCIWLNVPDYERDMVGDIMALPPDEGGLSDEQGMEIIEIFLVQNYDALADFFGERLSKLGQIMRKKSELHQQARVSPQSKR